VLDAHQRNAAVGGMINCERVASRVWLFPYMRDRAGTSEGYGIITILNPARRTFEFLDLSGVMENAIPILYDGAFAACTMFLSPYKVWSGGPDDVFDGRAIAIRLARCR